MTSIFSSVVVAVWCNVQVTTNSTEQNVSCERDRKYTGQDINHLYDILSSLLYSQQYYVMNYFSPVYAYIGLLYDALQ
jgi:hypothetical protein